METKATDLSALHPAFSAVRLNAADYFHHEWMCSQYSVTAVGNLNGVQVLANRKRKTKIASVQFDLSRVNPGAKQVLREILDDLGLPQVPAATRQETARLLVGAGMECVFSPKTQVQVVRHLKDDLVVEFLIVWSPDGWKDGLISFHSLDHVVNGAPAREKTEVAEMLSSVEFDLGLNLGYERE